MEWSDRIGRRIRLRDLHIVMAVAEAGGMARAAQKLSISHPVVSKTVSELEQTLGVKLFDRTAQGVELTNYGQALLKCSANVFEEMRQGLKQIEFLTDPTTGELAIGCPEIMNASMIPAISERLLLQHPRVQLHVVHADMGLAQYGPLRERKVELLIGRLPEPFMEEDLIFQPLIQEPFVAVAGANSQWARRRRIDLADLMGESLGASAAGQHAWIDHFRNFRCLRTQVAAARDCHIVRSTDHDPDRNQQVRWHSAELCRPIRVPAHGTENSAGQNSRDAIFDRHSHPEEPHARSSGEAVH